MLGLGLPGLTVWPLTFEVCLGSSPYPTCKILRGYTPETNSKVAPENWMLGRQAAFPFGIRPIFRGYVLDLLVLGRLCSQILLASKPC